jgi:hypothetical protein
MTDNLFTLIEDYSKHERIGKFVEADGKTYEIEVFYDIGGLSYFTGDNITRGYYLSVTPIEKGGGWRRVVLFSGIKALVKEAKRFSRKTLEQIALEQLDIENNPMVKKLYQHVLEKGS